MMLAEIDWNGMVCGCLVFAGFALLIIAELITKIINKWKG